MACRFENIHHINPGGIFENLGEFLQQVSRYPWVPAPLGSFFARPAPVAEKAPALTYRSVRWQSAQVSPRSASSPSRAMIGTIASAASGSAHHHPTQALSTNPPSRIAER